MSEPATQRNEASALQNRFARALSEVVKDNRWHPRTLAEREMAWTFRELLADAHGVRAIQSGRRVPAVRVSPEAMRSLKNLGGYEWLARLQPHEVLMAREAFCDHRAT
jgi:hypothetical protein